MHYRLAEAVNIACEVVDASREVATTEGVLPTRLGGNGHGILKSGSGVLFPIVQVLSSAERSRPVVDFSSTLPTTDGSSRATSG